MMRSAQFNPKPTSLLQSETKRSFVDPDSMEKRSQSPQQTRRVYRAYDLSPRPYATDADQNPSVLQRTTLQEPLHTPFATQLHLQVGRQSF